MSVRWDGKTSTYILAVILLYICFFFLVHAPCQTYSPPTPKYARPAHEHQTSCEQGFPLYMCRPIGFMLIFSACMLYCGNPLMGISRDEIIVALQQSRDNDGRSLFLFLLFNSMLGDREMHFGSIYRDNRRIDPMVNIHASCRHPFD
jgi:hypothetical protein